MLRRLLIDLAVMLAIGAALALLGPFGSYAAPFGLRLLFWLLQMIGGYALFMPAMRAATVAAARLQLPAAALWAAACALASAPMTAVVWVANGLWEAQGRPTLDAAVTLYGEVLVVAAIACTVLWFVTASRRRPVAVTAMLVTTVPAASPLPRPSPRLADRLPPHLSGDILALEMEDHYVRAHTPRGSHLLLLRMRDAVAELDGAAGAQVHRSWWVARGAVTGVARDGRNVRLKLGNGLEAPVARALAPALKAAGWW